MFTREEEEQATCICEGREECDLGKQCLRCVAVTKNMRWRKAVKRSMLLIQSYNILNKMKL